MAPPGTGDQQTPSTLLIGLEASVGPDDVGVAGEGLGSHQVPCLHHGWKGVAHTQWPLSMTALTRLWLRIRLVSQAFLSFVELEHVLQ